MTFTKEQIELLAPFEEYFSTAVKASWCRHPGSALQTIHRILHDATGDNRRLDTNCQHCIVSLMRDAGRLYFADREQMRTEVKVEDKPVKKVRAKVKTKK